MGETCLPGRLQLQLESLQGNVLGGEKKLARETTFRWAPAERLCSRDGRRVRIVILFRHMSKDEIPSTGVETIGVCKVFAHGVIGQVAGAGEHTLFDDPWIGADFEHVEIVVGFEDQTVSLAQVHLHVVGHVAEIRANGHLGAVCPKSESHGVDSIVGNAKSVDFDIADGETLAGLDGLDAVEAFAKRIRKNALQRLQGRLRDVERSFPKAESLREAVAVIGVFVGDQDAVEVVQFFFDGGEAGQSLALAQPGVHEDAGAFGLEQRDVARTAGRENGNAQTDGDSPEERNSKNEMRNLEDDGRAGESRQCASEKISGAKGGARG